MKLGIIGLPGSGKTTVFEALSGNPQMTGHKGESRIGTVQVPDTRVDILSGMYHPKKTITAQVEYFLPGRTDPTDAQSVWNQVRDADALIHVVRNFGAYGSDAPEPRKDFQALDQELMLNDQVIVEKRLERLALDQRRGQKIIPEELSLLQEALKQLENETPLRKIPEIAAAPVLRGYAFLSAKPVLVLFQQ